MKLVLSSAIALGIALAPALASAQATRYIDTDWRQTDRTDHIHNMTMSPQNFAFELRFGPYYPNVDHDSSLHARPYQDTFGDAKRFYFGMEFDWQAFRIPYIGAIGPGIGWGYTASSAKAPLADGSGLSGEDTSLTIMPMHVSAVLRVDDIYRRYNIPIVPYLKFGLGFATWSASNSAGASKVADPSNPQAAIEGRGITWGEHLALGGMLSLNWLDERAATRLDETTGVNHAYLFGEWMNAMLNGIGSRPQMHVGSSTWIVGLALDM